MLILRCNKICLTILAATVLLLLSDCTGEDQEPADPHVNLHPVFSFGHEGEVFLDLSPRTGTDRQDYIYIPQQQPYRIYQFDLDGTFRGQIGREGRGPGEFGSVWGLSLDSWWLYVFDTANVRLVKFGLDKDSSEVVNMDRRFIEFSVNRDRIFAFAPENAMVRVSEDLIRVYDKEGDLVDSFGEYLELAGEQLPARMSWPYLLTEQDTVHLIFHYFPVYRAYSIDGELLVEQDLSELNPDLPIHEQNYDESTYQSNTPTIQGVRPVVMGADVYNNRVFISRFVRGRIVIDEFKFSGQNGLTFTTTYFYEDLTEEYAVQNFFYHPDSNSFYINEYNNEFKVTVYKLLDEE